ncbi:MAG: LysE family translocator [Rhizobiaceae bacterium]
MSQLLPPLAFPFFLTALLVELTPGPNMTYLALVSASEGRRAGFETTLGIALGLALLGAIASLGVSEAIHASTLLYEMLRWAGVLFLLYLAWEGWVTGADIVSRPNARRGRFFTRGLFTNLLNPKAGVFYVSVLPTFIDPNGGSGQAYLLTAIYVAVATGVHLAIVLLAGTLERFLNEPARERVARKFLSALLAAVALWFAWSTHR